jgi:hypothetical protein
VEATFCPIPEGALDAIPGPSNPSGGLYHAEIKAATDALGPLPALTWTEKLDRLAKRLQKDTGWCWFAGGEALFVIREDGLWGEYHAVATNGGWTNSGRGKWIGVHRDTRVTDVGLSYPDPRQAKLKINVEDKGNRIDTTLTTDYEWEYCLAIRMGTFNGQPRMGCPVRPEGQADRVAWERVVLGQQKHWCDGVPMSYWRGNPAVAAGSCDGTYMTCSEDGAICREVNFD